MNKIKLSPLLLLLTFLISGCHDKEDIKKADELPTKFSKLTVAENKQNLENGGITLVNNVTDLKNASGIQTTVAFESFLENNPPDNLGSRVSSNGGLIDLLASFGNGEASVKKTLSGMRTAEFVSFQTTYNDSKGIYNYDKESDTWSFEDTGDKIVFNFPSTKEGTVNNAQYSIYDFTSVTIASDLGGDNYNGDYPTGVKVALTIDGVQKMSYNLSASYNTAGDPATISIITTIDDFALSYNVINTTTKVSVDYSLTRGGKNLLSLGVSSTGSFSSGSVEGSEGPTDVVESGTAYFQILNIKFYGLLNAKALKTATDTATTVEEVATAWNTNYKLFVYYADSNTKIADSEFYVNPATNESDEDSVEIRMIFADGTKSDLATYTDVGFEDLIDAVNTLFDGE